MEISNITDRVKKVQTAICVALLPNYQCKLELESLADQLISGNESILCFNSSGTAKVIVTIINTSYLICVNIYYMCKYINVSNFGQWSFYSFSKAKITHAHGSYRHARDREDEACS